jgi:uncharacterized membrane protein YeiH
VAFDLGGTFVFALSGAAVAVKHRLDLFGVLVLSFAAGNSGGIARDVMIGAVPPAAISDWRYIAVSIFAGLITFYWYRIVNRLRSPVLVFNAAPDAAMLLANADRDRRAMSPDPLRGVSCRVREKARAADRLNFVHIVRGH